MENNVSNDSSKNYYVDLSNYEPDYMGFVEEVWERESRGFPIDRTLLIELAKKYKTPIIPISL